MRCRSKRQFYISFRPLADNQDRPKHSLPNSQGDVLPVLDVPDVIPGTSNEKPSSNSPPLADNFSRGMVFCRSCLQLVKRESRRCFTSVLKLSLSSSSTCREDQEQGGSAGRIDREEAIERSRTVLHAQGEKLCLPSANEKWKPAREIFSFLFSDLHHHRPPSAIVSPRSLF